MFKIKYIIVLLILIPLWSVGNNVFKLNNPNTTTTINQSNFYIDTLGALTINDIEGLDKQFDSLGRYSKLNEGLASWVKVNLIIDTTLFQNISFSVDQANLDTVELYQKIENKWVAIKLGNDYEFDHRNNKTNHFVFDLKTFSTETEVYFRIRNHVATSFNILVGSRDIVLKKENNISILFFFLIGIIFAIIAYNTFLYVSLKEDIYLVYVISSSITGILQMILFGSSFQFLWTTNSWFQDIAGELFTIFGTIAGLFFMKMFLKMRQNSPTLDKVANFFIGFYTILFFVIWFNVTLVNQLLLMFQPIIAIYIFITAIVIVRTGFEPAKYYLRAWSIFLIGIIVFVLAEQGVIPRNIFTTLSLTMGAALEVVLLSFALANRINILKKNQEQSIANTLRLEKEKANLIIEQNIELEEQVEKRTHQLKEANKGLENKNEELNVAYSNLKNTQSQLVHAEKMSSLGQLTAGIAHEINNPINFVSSNILPLRRDIEDLIAIFEETKKYAESKLSAEDFSFINDLMEQYDFNFVVDEIEQLLSGMDDGANRTVEIIRGLKLFSRLDEDDLKRVNLEDGIDSTLILLNSAIKHNVTLTKKYGNIPEVECYGGKMNQVFMNIISNAVQAIESGNPGGSMEDNFIEITTDSEGDIVTISIADNGPGMSEEIKNKLFEPFFTTKAVGEGTGLGLSIVYKIIDKIDGKIQVNSEPGKGTEFVITLPINNKLRD